jgi:hypothetical protein
VNGDGYANDRAFVYNPAHTADPVLAASMRELLANGSPSARSCLTRQLGQLAALNSCEGPWIASASMNISLNPRKLRLPQRASVLISVNNPLGAADLALHGENHLQGWGQAPFVDNNLLYVHGFDPVNQRFVYALNQRFGSTNAAFNTALAPVSVVVMLRWDMAPTRERQILDQTLDRGRTTRGARVSELALKNFYGTNAIFNPLTQLLREADTLRLTKTQADSITVLNHWYTTRADSIWSPLARVFADLPNRYDHGAAYRRYKAAREATIDLLLTIAPGTKRLLSLDQLRRLPDIVSSALDTWYLTSIRSGTAGPTGNPFANAVGIGRQ